MFEGPNAKDRNSIERRPAINRVIDVVSNKAYLDAGK